MFINNHKGMSSFMFALVVILILGIAMTAVIANSKTDTLVETSFETLPYDNSDLQGAYEMPVGVNDISANVINGSDGKTMILDANDFVNEDNLLADVVGQLLSDPEVSHVQVIENPNANPPKVHGLFLGRLISLDNDVMEEE
jgi:hypothetical protein